MARMTEARLQRMQRRAERAEISADLANIRGKLAVETDPVKRAKLKAARAKGEFQLAQLPVRKKGNGGGE